MIFYAIGYVCMVVICTGFLVADFQAVCCKQAREMYRANLRFSVGLSLLPSMWLVVPFVTRFFKHGWQILPPEGNDEET